jgi:hypothetical protein
MSVTNTLPEFDRWVERAELVLDVIENSVKGKGDKYLPRPNPTDKSPENEARFKQYNERAIFVNYTGYTARGLNGAAFTKVPELKVPDSLEFVKTSVDGGGISIYQQSQKALAYVLACGRYCLLADYPEGEPAKTVAEQKALGKTARIIAIDPRNVGLWWVQMVGSQRKLTLVVIKDDQSEIGEDFKIKTTPQYMVLALGPAGYFVQLYRKSETDPEKKEWIKFGEPRIPVANGRPLQEIPFVFVGSENNDPTIDFLPMYDMAAINVGHYRNSADYEDSASFCGQAQPWCSGLDQEFLKMLKQEAVFFGSRVVFPVPHGEQLGIVQASPNTMCKEAMDSKEKQLAALGARIITAGSAVKTATQAQQENEAEHSILSLCCSNVSDAYTKMLQWVMAFEGVTSEATYAISQEFTKYRLDAQMIAALVQLWMTGKYPEGDFWEQLRKYGLIDPEKKDEKIKDETESTGTGLALDDNNQGETELPDEEEAA